MSIRLLMTHKYQLKLYNRQMGILDNFENAWDVDFQEEPKAPEFESSPIRTTDNMGRTTWATQLFKEEVCNNCGTTSNSNC